MKDEDFKSSIVAALLAVILISFVGAGISYSSIREIQKLRIELEATVDALVDPNE